MPSRKKARRRGEDDVDEDFRGPGDSPGSYDDWTVADLRRRAEQLGLSRHVGKKTKAGLVAMLRHH